MTEQQQDHQSNAPFEPYRPDLLPAASEHTSTPTLTGQATSARTSGSRTASSRSS
ncbi:hypothetical protein [Cellulomonas timonensis]|uniref:hypothetical protein n=1 Tax=Cellulomonas timonensis TaxID=1689271 RepID=UPI00131CB29E|nr:hypothetical protein [Cellulomonas timonensis]